ncbi:MAG: hypothetical protein ACP5OZ_00115 [Candidatus Woesearchaeota archaeon]
MNSEFFVRIEEPRTLRKELLETSKITINLLKKQENIKKIKIEKRETISRIRKKNSEIKLLLERMEKLMPEISMEKKIEPEYKIAESNIDASKKLELRGMQKNIRQSIQSIQLNRSSGSSVSNRPSRSSLSMERGNASLEKLKSLEKELKELEEKIKNI